MNNLTTIFQVNRKYKATVKMPYGIFYLDINVLNIKAELFSNSIQFETLQTSKDVLPESGHNPVTIPEHWIISAQLL